MWPGPKVRVGGRKLAGHSYKNGRGIVGICLRRRSDLSPSSDLSRRPGHRIKIKTAGA